MTNEIILIINLVAIYSGVLLAYKLFGKEGLYSFTVFACITANIEVLILIDGFGLEQTLGNIAFASTFLTSDILSENHGKKAAQKAVNLGIATSIFFVIITQIWLMYTPSANDQSFANIKAIFATTPRLILASLVVYAISQKFDVWIYHKIWTKTTKLTGNKTKLLWIRNNASTLTSQLINSILFTLLAFYNVYEMAVLKQIIISTYLIFVVTSLLDTPIIYLARKIKPLNVE